MRGVALVALVVDTVTKRLPTLRLMTIFVPINEAGMLTATVTFVPLRFAEAVDVVTVPGAAAAGTAEAGPPTVSAGRASATGVTGADAAEVAPGPWAFVALTVNVYDAPFTRPLTVQVVAGVAGATDVTEHDSPVPAVTV